MRESSVSKRVREVLERVSRFFGYNHELTFEIDKTLDDSAEIDIDPQYLRAHVKFNPLEIADAEDLDETILHEAIHLTQIEFFNLRNLILDQLPPPIQELAVKIFDVAVERNVAIWEKILKDLGIDTQTINEHME